MTDIAAACAILAAMRDAEDDGAPLPLAEATAGLEISDHEAADLLDWLERNGLVLPEFDGQPPLLLTAGRQFLGRRGMIDEDVLGFLARVIDDLVAREALLVAGRMLVDDFRAAAVEGRLHEHARDVVPTAFSTAIGPQDAVDLFACAVALVARLSCGEPAGCVGEELMAVALLSEAAAWIEGERNGERLAEVEADNALNELRALFDLFSDDDILDLFEMREPADAALARHQPRNQEHGVVDQRLEAWFDAFDGTPATGHLRAPRRPGE